MNAYALRFRRVLEHVDAHLDEDLSGERLSGVAAFSKYHFHRQFSELFGMGVYEYVKLVRLKRASYRLAFREWDAYHSTFRRLSELRSRHMKPAISERDVKIVEFEETPVACLEHRGDPRLIGDSIRRFVAWRKQRGLSPKTSATFNVLYDDLERTPPSEFRLDICVATDRGAGENSQGVVDKTIPGGRCAVVRHIGSDDTLDETIGYLYSKWLPASAEEPRDFPLFIQRVRFFPDVPEHEAVSDVFLPLK